MSPLRARLLDRRSGALLMGVLNRTPDSFSDGGKFVADEAARAQVARLLADGADIVDVGAESTRPGAPAVSASEQLSRIGSSVREAVACGALVSIDTTSPEVAERALADGARIVNSVSLDAAAELARLAARHGASLVLMHSRGSMTDMRGFSMYADDAYGDVVADVARELRGAAERAIEAGLPREDVVLDPGLGFAKNARHSLELVARLDELRGALHETGAADFELLVGPSRKSFLVTRPGEPKSAVPPPHERLGATIAACIACVQRGAAIVRVHDVAPVRQALDFAARVLDARMAAWLGPDATAAEVARFVSNDLAAATLLGSRGGGHG